jgi:alginate O-acetyltransferase complex protein AlgI
VDEGLLYFQLGGNKVNSKFRLYFNLCSSPNFWLWHGAAWTFIAWGAFHGVFLILDRLFLLKVLNKVGKIPATLFTFIVTMIGWVIFRSTSMTQAFDFVAQLFAFNFGKTGYLGAEFIAILIIAIAFSFITAFRFGKKIEEKIFYSKYTNTRYVIMAGCCCFF